jgi:hypothetical protein
MLNSMEKQNPVEKEKNIDLNIFYLQDVLKNKLETEEFVFEHQNLKNILDEVASIVQEFSWSSEQLHAYKDLAPEEQQEVVLNLDAQFFRLNEIISSDLNNIEENLKIFSPTELGKIFKFQEKVAVRIDEIKKNIGVPVFENKLLIDLENSELVTDEQELVLRADLAKDFYNEFNKDVLANFSVEEVAKLENLISETKMEVLVKKIPFFEKMNIRNLSVATFMLTFFCFKFF